MTLKYFKDIDKLKKLVRDCGMHRVVFDFRKVITHKNYEPGGEMSMACFEICRDVSSELFHFDIENRHPFSLRTYPLIILEDDILIGYPNKERALNHIMQDMGKTARIDMARYIEDTNWLQKLSNNLNKAPKLEEVI